MYVHSALLTQIVYLYKAFIQKRAKVELTQVGSPRVRLPTLRAARRDAQPRISAKDASSSLSLVRRCRASWEIQSNVRVLRTERRAKENERRDEIIVVKICVIKTTEITS